MKRMLLFGAIFILCISIANALTESTETLYAGDSVFFEGYNIFLSISTNGEKILVQVDNNPYFIDLGVTGDEFDNYRQNGDENINYNPKPSIRHEDLKVSLKKTCFDVSDNDCGRVNDVTKLVDPAFELELSFEEPELSVTREYSSTDVVYGEKINVKVTVENKGDVDVEDFLYQETYPNSIEIIPGSSTSKTGQKISYETNLIQEGDSKTFKYKIFVKDTLEYSLKGKYSYYYRDEKFEMFTDSSIINLLDIISPELTLSQTEVSPGESLDLVVKLENNIDKDVDYFLELDIPLEVTQTPIGFIKQDSKYILENSLDESEKISKTFKVKSETEGTFEATGTLNSNYIIDNPTQHISDTVDVSYDYDGCTFCASLFPEDESLLETEYTTLEAHFVRNENVQISDIKATVTGTIGNEALFDTWKFSIPSLGAIYINKYLDFILPETETQDIKFEINGTYKIEYLNGTISTETFSESTNAKVYALEDAIEISQTLSPSSIKQGEVSMVKVNVENKLDSRGFRQVYAFDDTPDDFVYKEIITDTFFNLEPLEEKQIYSYELKAPFFVNTSNSKAITTLLFEDFNITETNDISSNVELKEPEIEIFVDHEEISTVGAITRIGFRIQNTGDIDINKLKINFPVSESLELFNSPLTYKSTLLEPGEEIEIFKDYRVKKEGNATIDKTLIKTEDVYGNLFESINEQEIITSKSGAIACYVDASKELDELANNKVNKVPLTIKFDNNCDKEVTIESDAGSITIAPNGKGEISYEEVHLNTSEEISPTIYTYSYENRRYSSKTNDIPARESEAVKVIEIEKEEEKQPIITIEKPPKEKFDLDFLKQIFLVVVIALVMVGLMAIILKAKKNKDEKPTEEKSSLLQKPEKVEKIKNDADITKEKPPELIQTTQNTAPELGQDLDKVKDYINQSKNAGLNEELIKSNLEEKGWDESLIEVFIK